MKPKSRSARMKRTPPATPTPIPILAPVERPELLVVGTGVLELPPLPTVVEEELD